MKRSLGSILPWALAGLFAAAFLVLLLQERSAKTAAAPLSGSSPSASRLTPTDRKILYWVDPMHPQYKSDKPGKAPDCGMDLVPVYADGGAEAAAPVEGYAPITLSPGRQQAIGAATGPVERRDLVQTIRAVGRVAVDERRLHRVHAKFEGYVEKLFVDFTGRQVQRGEALLSIYSPDLFATQQEYLLAYRARRDLAASPNREVARGASELYESARQRLLLWDIQRSEIARLERTGQSRKALTLVSPAGGIVVAKNAVLGGRVLPSESLFEIADLLRVWVLADVYESEIPSVRTGQTARMTLSYLPGRTWTGKVTFISPVVNPDTRTVSVRLEFDNSDRTLKPEMFAEVVLERSLGSVVAVPEGAVLSTGIRSLVFVDKGEGRFEPREVEPGAKVDRWWEIREGLTPGERVVTQANFLIDSESRLKAAFGGLVPSAPGHQHGAPPAAPPATRAPKREPSPTATPDHSGHDPAAHDHSGAESAS
jgi:Cu(I)/Ag(I) efflux system membrane fusion protein